MHFIAEASSNGVVERDFTVGEVTGVLWSPVSGPDHAPLLLMGHGGGQHKKAPGFMARARTFVATGGFAVAAIDLPGHGDRPRTAADEQHWIDLRQARAAGEPIGPIVVQYTAGLAERAVREWQLTLDALRKLPEIDAERPVGYCGAMMSTAIGVPLIAADPRIAAAVLRSFFCSESLLEAAHRVTVPVRFLIQWDDEHIERQAGLDLFDAFGSREKTLHANAGGHHELPWFEEENIIQFFARHLG